jgi:ABC-type transport system involved in multi-copper enzyme maturation permease subunit
VFGVLLVGNEYSSGTIRASLMAVPRRGLWYGGKVLAGALPLLGASLAIVLATFFAAQAALGPYATSFGADGVPVAIAGACLYLTLVGLLAVGLSTMLRSSTWSLAILLPLLFLGSQGLGNVPKLRNVWQYLPDQAGAVLMHLTLPGDPQFGRDYGPWTAFSILVAWAAAALTGGYLLLHRRDA